jgi:hypothetical protein
MVEGIFEKTLLFSFPKNKKRQNLYYKDFAVLLPNYTQRPTIG